MYESKSHAPIPRKLFIKRVALHAFAAIVLLVLSVAIGMAGYIYYEGLACSTGSRIASVLTGSSGTA